MNFVELVGAIGEFVIAGVIFWEMEESRRDRFLAEARDVSSYENRGKIYSAFCDTAAESLDEKAKRFCERVWKDEKYGDVELKACCEKQIVLFNRLGQIRRHASIYKGDYVKLFPHAVILFWVMIEPYIQDRRAMTGKWWARDFEQLTKKCLQFILESDPRATLCLYDRDRERKSDLIVRTDQLLGLQQRLGQR